MTELTMSTFTDQSRVKQADILLVGIGERTNNQREASGSGVIPATVARFWSDNLGEQISGRLSPERSFAVYTDYDNGAQGDYTYFYGQQVESFDDVPEGLQTLTIPAAHYQRFTTQAGPMPHVVVAAWQSIWQMSNQELHGERAFIADFEVYDERATNPSNSIIDIFIGIR